MSRLHGKVAVITGGAGGIGRAACGLFALEGASVLLVDKSSAGTKQACDAIAGTKQACDAIGGTIAGFVADVTDPVQVAASYREAERRFGGLDIALLNAGVVGVSAPVEDYPLEIFDALMAVNVRAVWLGLRAAIGPMRRRGGGSIVITSSIQGLSALPNTSAYTTSKHAVVGMMKGAALELAKDKIRVNCVHPGMTDTPMMDQIHEASGAPLEMAAAVRATIPMHRYATPDEVARMMLFLASDESSYCTGASFLMDGGILASWTNPPD